MKSPVAPASPARWTSLWAVGLTSLVAQLALCQFFSFGKELPLSLDINPSNLWRLGYAFPPVGTFHTLNWLGVAFLPQPLNPFSLAAAILPPWLFFTAFVPVISTLALLAMAAFLRELELSRPAALFGAVIYAWQGDLISFIYPGHYAYMTTWLFFALAAWGALRSQRLGHWAYPLISGVSCGLMVGLQPDRGGIASLLIAALYLAPMFRQTSAKHSAQEILAPLPRLVLCVLVAALVALAPVLALYQSNIQGVTLGGEGDADQIYKRVTQFSLGPAEMFTYLVPGFFGWHINNVDGPYWGWIGQWPDWEKHHQGTRNLNLAISTTGTIATILALIGTMMVLPGSLMGPARMADRTRFFTRVLLACGVVTLVLSWGWHTPFYRPLTYLPLMDKWRNPLKWLEMTNFALIVLSALGAQHLLESLDAATPIATIIRRRMTWMVGGLVAVFSVVFLLSFPLSLLLVPFLQQDGFDEAALRTILHALHVSLFMALILTVMLGTVLLAVWHPDTPRRWTMVNPWLQRVWVTMLRTEYLPLSLALSLALLSALQLGWVASHFIVSWPVGALTDSNEMLNALGFDTNKNHVRVSVANEDPVLNTMLQNQFAAMNISCLDISAASRIPDDLAAFFAMYDDNRTRLWFLAGVKDLALPQQLVQQMQQDPVLAANVARADGFTIAPPPGPNLPSHAIVTLKDYLAKATFVPGVTVLSNEALVKKMKDPAWNPRETLLLEHPVTISVPPSLGPVADTNTVDLQTYTTTHIDITAKTKRSGFILINDQFDPDWQLQVNGHDEPLLRADYIMRAAAIPAGESKISLRYVAHYRIGHWSFPAMPINLFSDGIMLIASLFALVGLRRQSVATQ